MIKLPNKNRNTFEWQSMFSSSSYSRIKNSLPQTSLLRVISGAILAGGMSLISSCSHSSGRTIEVYETVGYQPNYGPFDSNGNYVDKWADNPPKRRYIPRNQKKASSAPLSTPTPAPQYIAVAPKPAPQYTLPQRLSSTNRQKKSVKVKSTPPVTHTVKKGDTLYALSRKYKTSVDAIQRANRLKGTIIGIDQRLIIPK